MARQQRGCRDAALSDGHRQSLPESRRVDGGHTGGHILDIAGGISSHPANAPNEENPGETGVLMSGEESGEIAETSLSGRNRSRICDLLHVK